MSESASSCPENSAVRDSKGLQRYFALKACAEKISYCSFAYSALASFRMGMSGSASLHNVRKSL